MTGAEWRSPGGILGVETSEKNPPLAKSAKGGAPNGNGRVPRTSPHYRNRSRFLGRTSKRAPPRPGS